MTNQRRSLHFRKLIAIVPIFAIASGAVNAIQIYDGGGPGNDGETVIETPEWSYDAPDEWGMVAGSEICETGMQQSPIDIKQSARWPRRERVRGRQLRDIEFDYGGSWLTVENKNYTAQVDYEAGSRIRLRRRGPWYEVKHLQFHAPAEHSFERGALHDMEMQILHKSTKDPDQLVVVSVLIEEGEENEAFASLLSYLGAPTNAEAMMVAGDEMIYIEDMLPDDRRYFRYTGSLTTPPCTEGVVWYILAAPIDMSKEQIDVLKKVVQSSSRAPNGNNRPTQDLNGRRVDLDQRKDRPQNRRYWWR